jgi:flagellar motor switch protein FliM
MSRILTQAEIDALLTSVPVADGRSVDTGTGQVMAYDFRHPDRVSKDQIRSLQLLHDRYARNVTTSLGAYLRSSVELSVTAVEQFSYSEFLLSLPDPTAFYGVSIRNFDTLGALEMNPGVAFTIVDRMLGGAGRGAAPDRALTEIEQTVVDSVVRLLLEHLTETWRAVIDNVQFTIQGRETRPQMLPVAGRNEIMIVMAFDIKIAEVHGMLHVCLPVATVEAAGLSFSQGWQQAASEPTTMQRGWLLDNVGRIQLPVTASLTTSLFAREVLQLAEGDLINLGVPTQAPINVQVGELVKYSGRLTTRNARAAVVIERTSASRPSGTGAQS